MNAKGPNLGEERRPHVGAISGWRTVGDVLQDLARRPEYGWLRAALTSSSARRKPGEGRTGSSTLSLLRAA